MISAQEAAPSEVLPLEPTRPAAILRGGARGLEIVVDALATPDAIAAAVTARIAEAPAFFRGSDARVRIDNGPLPRGALALLDDIAARFGLRILEVAPTPPAVKEAPAIPEPQLAAGSIPIEPIEPVIVEIPGSPLPEKTRVIVGPVRSGVILDHAGHIVIFGDVNPGAEVRAEGNIVVLGRLKGTAHAGIGRDAGFILALRLEPQQLRICRMVARAGDSDRSAGEAELAYVAGDSIIVERYQGKLPRSLAESI